MIKSVNKTYTNVNDNMNEYKINIYNYICINKANYEYRK
jgi:hypothetical protein